MNFVYRRFNNGPLRTAGPTFILIIYEDDLADL